MQTASGPARTSSTSGSIRWPAAPAAVGARTRAGTGRLATVNGEPVPVAFNTNTTTDAVNRDYAVPTYEALEASGGFTTASVGYEGTASDGLTMLDAPTS